MPPWSQPHYSFLHLNFWLFHEYSFLSRSFPSFFTRRFKTMPISFGSVGDIIAICLLVKDLVAALDESKGSAVEYREVLLELRALERGLLEVDVLSRSHAPTVKLNALYATARKAALDCRQPVEAFLDRIKKYDPSLGTGVSKISFETLQ